MLARRFKERKREREAKERKLEKEARGRKLEKETKTLIHKGTSMKVRRAGELAVEVWYENTRGHVRKNPGTLSRGFIWQIDGGFENDSPAFTTAVHNLCVAILNAHKAQADEQLDTGSAKREVDAYWDRLDES